jgi:hypothetical protein
MVIFNSYVKLPEGNPFPRSYKTLHASAGFFLPHMPGPVSSMVYMFLPFTHGDFPVRKLLVILRG